MNVIHDNFMGRRNIGPQYSEPQATDFIFCYWIEDRPDPENETGTRQKKIPLYMKAGLLNRAQNRVQRNAIFRHSVTVDLDGRKCMFTKSEWGQAQQEGWRWQAIERNRKEEIEDKVKMSPRLSEARATKLRLQANSQAELIS